jgi:hypothetical protein
MSYPLNLNNVQCMGLNQVTANNAQECQAAACNAGQPAWQWCPSGAGCGNQACWIGQDNDCNHQGNGWQGGGTNQSLPWAPPASQPNYDDSAWTVLDIPHDFEITGTYSQNANEGEGYLPYNVRRVR